jgi:hypothetical protein
LDQLDWIVGKWQLGEKNVYEVWQKEEGKLKGTSFVIVDTDTMILEHLSLHLINDTIYYVPTVLNQNDGKPVEFKLESKLNNSWRFTNPLHDFPQSIEYKLLAEDSIKVTLMGTPNRKNEFLLLRHE